MSSDRFYFVSNKHINNLILKNLMNVEFLTVLKKNYFKLFKIHFFSYTFKNITKVAINNYYQFKNLLF